VSFILDPPALIVLGMAVYYLSRRFRLNIRTTLLIGAVISLGMFVGGSTLLYLDIIDWPLPPTEGPVWMFHTNYTGIDKADVPVALAAFMLLVYPIWHIMGYLLALRLDVGSFLIPIVSYGDAKSRREKPETRFTVRRGGTPRQMTREAIEELGGIRNFVGEGDRVVIKPNICGGNPQIPGSFTSIEIVDELVKMIREVGAHPVVADSDMIWTRFDPVAEAEGWKEWAKQEDVPLINLKQTKRIRFNFGRDSSVGIVPVSREMVEADVIISVPVMKTHLLTNVTLGMKNMYGTFPQENKAKFHRFGIENVIYEVNKAFTPHLTIIDGTVGGECYGPLSCKPMNYQTLVASNDVVAADAVACILMGYQPQTVLHIRQAHREGLGNGEPTFDPKDLPSADPRDGNWEKPDPKVTAFYEALVEASLHLPGMQDFFDAAADFALYGLATLPMARDLTPQTEKLFNDVLGGLFRSGFTGRRWTKEDLDRFTGLARTWASR